MNQEQTERIKQAKAAYARRYRQEHPERVKAAQDKYWAKKAKEQDTAPEEKKQ